MAAELAVKENMIEMSMLRMATNRTSPRRRSRAVSAAVALGCLLVLAMAGAANAAPVWQISSEHGPTNFEPGSAGQYVILAQNLGDSDTSGPITVVDTLPPGVTATSASGSDWSCTVDPGTVTCTTTDTVFAPSTGGFLGVFFRGGMPALYINVTVDAGASGTADNQVTIDGGGALGPASTTDPTTFSATPAPFGFSQFRFDSYDAAFPAGNPVRQAGAHPFETRIDFASTLKLTTDASGTYSEPVGHLKTVNVKLPPGFIGNPEATPKCQPEQLGSTGFSGKPSCPAASQVGSADLILQNGATILFSDTPAYFTTDVPIYNMVPPKGTVAAFAFSFFGQGIWMEASLDPVDHSVITTIKATNEVWPPREVHVTLWGVPADPAHDALRIDTAGFGVYGASSTGPVKPFLTLPSRCGVDESSVISADSWQQPGVVASLTSPPFQVTGCEDPRMRFDSSIKVRPTSGRPNDPAGLSVDLSVAQKDDTIVKPGETVGLLYDASGSDRAVATPPLRNATFVLPEGLAVSPSSADGLGSCSPAQIGLTNNDDPACPDSAKIGTVSIETPLLPAPLEGGIYLAQQGQNPFGSMLALYLVAKGPGIMLKLPGKIAPNATTGQLTATFDDNPQLPFSLLHLQFKGGPRAPLVTPSTCGLKTTTATLVPWGGPSVVTATDAFDISGDGNGAPCPAAQFKPSFTAGAQQPVAGHDSPFVVRFSRADADQQFDHVDVSLPAGVLGRISKTELCADVAAALGTCGDASKIGTVTVGAGPGSNPFFLDGRAYITGPYKGAPFGLSIVVPAKAGPLDLGTVVVRAAIFVDKHSTALRVISDPMPTILAGIPLQIRVVDITLDRAGFMFNPTSCSRKTVGAQITSTAGAAASVSSPFRVTNCAALAYKPRLSIRVGAKKRTRRGASTPLSVTLRQSPGQANNKSVTVTLPATLNARLGVVQNACTQASYDAGTCTSRARVGSAVAVTPVLRGALRGSAYFVKNPRRSLPDLVVQLRGQVSVDLVGKVSVVNNKLLRTKFDTIPDVPISSFTLRLVAGGNGPVGTTTNLCTAKAKRATAKVEMRAQNGKLVRRSQRLSVAGCRKARKR